MKGTYAVVICLGRGIFLDWNAWNVVGEVGMDDGAWHVTVRHTGLQVDLDLVRATKQICGMGIHL